MSSNGGTGGQGRPPIRAGKHEISCAPPPPRKEPSKLYSLILSEVKASSDSSRRKIICVI